MRKVTRRFARFYYDDFLDEYPEVYANDAAFATWMRLLVMAEKAWPARAELPRSVKARSLATLVDAGLVALGPAHTFAIRGHDAERSRRHGAAMAGAGARWEPDALPIAEPNVHAVAPPSAMPSKEQDETRTDTPPPQVGRRANGTNPRATGTNPRATGTSPRQEREKQKRASMPDSVAAILRRAAAAGNES